MARTSGSVRGAAEKSPRLLDPAKYWFSTLSDDTPLETLVDITMLRWRIERDYQELKSELGLAHYEGRG